MFPVNLPLAFLMIVGPDYVDAACPLTSLQCVALQLELLDPREAYYYFVREAERKIDLETVRRRWRDVRDAPPVADAARWPSREFCAKAKDINREYRCWLREHQRIDRGEWIDDAVADLDRLYRVWDLASDANCEFYYITVRRRSLLDLRAAIGADLYYMGCLPGPLPAWTYKVIEE